MFSSCSPCHLARARFVCCSAIALGLVLLMWPATAAAVSIPGQGQTNPAKPVVDPALRMAEARSLPPAAALMPAATAEAERLQQMTDYNRSGALPMQNGFSRSLPSLTVHVDSSIEVPAAPIPYSGGLLLGDGAAIVWTARFDIEGAYASRLRLHDVSLPPGTKIWVYGAGSIAEGPVGVELIDPEGTLWLPPVEGATVYLEVRSELGAISDRVPLHFAISEVMELFDVGDDHGEAWTDCDIDATCVTSATLSMVDDYYDAVAHLFFRVGGFGYICSGALVNTTPFSGTPYLLTANHCFSTQASATSLIAYFDFRTSTCNGAPPPLTTVPKVFGSTLLASNSQSDFTFVELNSNPTGTNYYLGWSTTPPAHLQQLHRISHPAGTAQKYSSDDYLATGGIVCGGLPRPHFNYSQATQGSTTGGSSGAPVIMDSMGGQIVGQLYGKCYYGTLDECIYTNYNTVDGAFSTTYGYISTFLESNPNLIFSDGFESGDTTAWSATVD